jgi:replicative DNA helicase
MLDTAKFYSLEAEAGVLGSMILDERAALSALELLQTDDFFKPEHGLIFTALANLALSKTPIDGVMLRTELKNLGKLDEIGGVEYLKKILDSVPSAANCRYYCGVVKDRAKYRELARAAERMQAVLNEPLSVAEQTEEIQNLVLNLESQNTESDFVDVKNRAVDASLAMRDEPKFIKTGFNEIDRLITGFCPGEFCILAGRPSMGKSSLGLAIALNQAVQGRGILYVTLEMSADSLIERAVCSLSKTCLADAKGDRLSEGQWNDIYETALQLKDKNLVFSCSASTPERILLLCRKLKKTHNIGIVFVDYLQLLTAGEKTENRQQEISAISRKLKALAMNENLPLVALSQMNRETENRENRRPRLSDLRDSGSLEQDADIVMGIYRPDYYRKIEDDYSGESDGLTEVLVLKNRRGQTGTAKLVFLSNFMTFGDCAKV